MCEDPADMEVSLKLQGTDEENLLRWATGNPTELLRVHLCGGACPDRLEADNLLHGVSISKRVTEDLPWMSNLVDALEPGRSPAEAGLLSGEAKGGEGRRRSRQKEVERGRSKKREIEERRGKGRSEERDRSRGRSKEKISLRGRRQEEARGRPGGNGALPGSEVSQEVCQQGPEASQEEEEIVFQRQLKQQRQLLQRGVTRSICRGTQSPPHRQEGTWPPSSASSQRDAGGSAVEHWRHLASGGIGAAPSFDPVLPPRHGPSPPRSPFERGFDSLLCGRPDLARSGGRIGRLSGAEVEIDRIGFAGCGMANSSEARGFASGTPCVINEERSQRGNKGTKRGIENQVGSIPSEGERRRMEGKFLVRERRRRQQKREGTEGPRQEGEAEGRAKEVGEKRGEVEMRMKYEPPTDGAPFEGELMEVEPGGALGIFRKVLTTERHVDAEVGGEAMADVRLGSLATSLPSPSERLNMVALEKECMKPPSAGDSFAEAVPWVLSMLVHTCEKIGLDLRCKAQPKGDVFPLPTSMVYLKKMVEAPEHELVIVRGMCCALNSFYGESVENSFYPTKVSGADS